ncbi:hypothetical protein D9611_003207 [Ephemerocybe angulata]|uniref:ARM repeat-containing protein n=1 Tax=Ephemerocybe angulata TaxID=980116 RepID=A0A8H5CA48_9AGAR|nr:hypothetical protein D9611_003207 [Tulosesus angulatus]
MSSDPDTGPPSKVSTPLSHMEEDEISFDDLLGDDPKSAYAKQVEAIQTHLKSLPYECETPEQMQRALEDIVAKISIAAKAQNWLVLGSWDGLLQCWLTMAYPVPKPTRAKLVRVYYELTILPGVEIRYLRNWADMFTRLLFSKSSGWLHPKLGPADLQLPWKPMWRSLKKELWPKSTITDSQRNLVNILLYIAYHAKFYFSADDIPEMLETFLPMFTQETALTMIPVLTSFLPPTRPHLYLPALFRIWEAFNSSIIDDRMLELCADLSEDHVAGQAGDLGELAPQWKEVGIWSQWEWDFLSAKALGSLNVPIGMMKNSGGNTSQHADLASGRKNRIKKSSNKMNAISKLFVYSMRLDGEVRPDTPVTGRRGGALPKQVGFAGGSKALDTLEKLVNSIETFFHPSNLGNWTPNLTLLLSRLANDFLCRTKEEELPTCKTPESQRLTPQIRRQFVKLLVTPALLGIFSKDQTSASYAQASLPSLARLEPGIVMPEVLERAYGGLEVVNETHRTTAVLSALKSVCQPMLTESIWLGGQKHLLPLLELCLPGIDLNDPSKTIRAAMFITEAVKNVIIGDVSASHVGGSYDDGMDVDDQVDHIPDGTEFGDNVVLSREDERSLVRDSTASFSDWVLTLFRRVFSLYENLPEEGGKKNTTGGKDEEVVLKSIKTMLDLICQQLSEPLFDLVLKLVFDYGTTNAKSNAVRAFGQLVGSLARAYPEKTTAKFLPFCAAQIEEELTHGASSVRTTSTHAAAPSDTTLHWNLSILRGCLGHGGATLVKHKETILRLLAMLVEKTKSERGYTSTGRLISRILDALHSTYPLDTRLVNPSEWNDPKFMANHNLYWGKMYEPKDVVIDWHVASNEDIDFILEILDRIEKPALDVIESLLDKTANWDNVSRNDFCRYLHAARSVWLGLSSFIKLPPVEVVNPLIIDKFEMPEMMISSLDLECGFPLSDPSDARWQKTMAYRERYGNIVLRAASLLRQNAGGEDHADALMTVTRSLDTHLLNYCQARGDFDSLQKTFRTSRDANRIWHRQKDNFRAISVQRANLYHTGRVYVHAMYRKRSDMDDRMIAELAELSLSPYTRIRRQAQHSMHMATLHFVRSTRLVLPIIFNALGKGTDPDRMKGALYMLWVKGIAAYAIADHEYQQRYLVTLLECQHEDKPSVQKLVNNISNDCLSYVHEDAFSTDSYKCDSSRVDEALKELASEFTPGFVDSNLASQFVAKSQIRRQDLEEVYQNTLFSVLEIATRPTTHWRYVQIAIKILTNLIRRDAPVPPELGKFFAEQTLSPQPTIRIYAQKALIRILYFAKARTHSKSMDELWYEEWRHPLKESLPVNSPEEFMESLRRPVSESGFFVDKVNTGFLTWGKTIDVYRPATEPSIQWESLSAPVLAAIFEVISRETYFKDLTVLWGQEPTKPSSTISIRSEYYKLIKYMAKIYGAGEWVTRLLEVTNDLVADADKFKQRAGADYIAGILRGSKHWGEAASHDLWTWLGGRLDLIYSQMKPETTNFWQCVFHEQLIKRDPRRSKVLVDWILALPLEFAGESAFQMTKAIGLLSMLLDGAGLFFKPESLKYAEIFFANAGTDYAEIRMYLCQNLYLIMRNLWQPSYPSIETFLTACNESSDPLQIRQAIYQGHVASAVENLLKWREERLPPPRVNQSEYDKVGLTILQWLWISAHGPPAHLIIPYVVSLMPEILRMSELNDNPEIQAYSSGALYILSALDPLSDFVEPILDKFVESIESSKSWKTRLHGLPALVIFFYRNLLSLSPEQVDKVLRVLLDCLSNENVEVREMASKVLSGVVRTSQRQNIIPLKNRFVTLAKKTTLPSRKDPEYATALRTLHSAILGLCSLVESFPYSIEPWLPPLTEVLAPHATDPPPISTTIRNCASEFKKTHQDTWHKDQLLFDEDQLQSLSTMLVGTSYYA